MSRSFRRHMESQGVLKAVKTGHFETAK